MPTQVKSPQIASSIELTTPKIITSINDANGNEVIKTPATTSAVNEITITNAATTGVPTISATGGDTNISLGLTAKGTGKIKFNSPFDATAVQEQTTYTNVASNLTTTSTNFTYIDSTNFKSTLVIKEGNLVQCNVTHQGIWNTSAGYLVIFGIGVDGTASAFGYTAWCPSSMTYNAYTYTVNFTGITPGTHTFYPLWKTTGAGTASMAQYATQYLTVTEIMPTRT